VRMQERVRVMLPCRNMKREGEGVSWGPGPGSAEGRVVRAW
jgi:hypothetical protein